MNVVLLRRMKLWQKFATLGVIALLCGAIPLTLVLRQESAELAVARDELTGLEPLRLAVRLQQSLQAHRVLAGHLNAGQPVDAAQRQSSEAEVAAAAQALGKRVGELGYTKAVQQLKTL